MTRYKQSYTTVINTNKVSKRSSLITMIKWLMPACLVAMNIAAFAQDLYICKVQGLVNLDKVPLKVGDKVPLKDATAFEFASEKDYVVLISAEKGRCVVSPSQGSATARKSSTDNHLWLFVKDNLVPCPKVNSLFSRGIEEDVRDYLRDGRWVMLDSLVVPLSAAYMNDDQTFRISYHAGNRDVAKDYIPRRSYPFLVFNRETFTVDKTYWDPSHLRDISIALHDTQFDMTRTLINLSITSLGSPAILEELRALRYGLVEYTKGDGDRMKNEMRSHVEQYYGNIDGDTLTRLMEKLRIEN
ncbi:hypothetical protein WBG78_08035 [Chryseolinea sp. T2]|uniref:hypothetical protein n=1 Tax=Chryseolinea sp. T2 TaxID=3129255 RepID=UPI0030787E91